ncbi:unnamed protein product [Echinostoma caproni]|uniref:Ig-like domain-containing protein n=1 Tax=Echinostoma caproni TaxID=27848 RepID=A0A183AW41_9TREM|nr:unnamed protein product [Echinostoma caproni]
MWAFKCTGMCNKNTCNFKLLLSRLNVDNIRIEPVDINAPDASIVEFHPVRFHCSPGRRNPRDTELNYIWTISPKNSGANPARRLSPDSVTSIIKRPDVRSIPRGSPITPRAFDHSGAWFELLPTRETNGRVLSCTVQSRLPAHYSVNQGNQITGSNGIEIQKEQTNATSSAVNVVSSTGTFTMNVVCKSAFLRAFSNTNNFCLDEIK